MLKTQMLCRTPKDYEVIDTERIRREAEEREIGRLCHFTVERNIGPILLEGQGVLAPSLLPNDRRRSIRMDGFLDCACLSVEFPNTWLLQDLRSTRATWGREEEFVVLYIRPHYLWRLGTKFCPVNAATGSGERVADGCDGFRCMYAQTVTGKWRFCRQPRRLACAPTDEQAEVLVPGGIDSTDIVGIAVQDEDQARRVSAHWRNPSEAPRIVVVPEYYDPDRLKALLQSGRRPIEHLWTPGGTHDD